MSILRYTGHPFVDVGVATIAEFAEHDQPSDITKQDLQRFTEYITDIYTTYSMRNYLTGAVFPNVGFANVSTKDSDRRSKLTELLSLADDPAPELISNLANREIIGTPFPGDRCTFSGDEAVARVCRTVIPLTLARDAINFVPLGRTRLPIAGWVLVALLAIPIGTLKAEGKVFLTHTFHYQLLQQLVKKNLKRNQDDFHLQGLAKQPDYKSPKTILIQDLVETVREVKPGMTITIYWFTSNYQGPSNTPPLRIIHLPDRVVDFITQAATLSTWNEVVRRAWSREDALKDTMNNKGRVIEYKKRNYFYDDIFILPQGARRFLSIYLLRRRPKGKRNKKDPRYEYSFIKEREVISWELIKLFVEKVMDMDKERIEAIKQLADRLATYIQTDDDRLYKRLYLARTDYHIRLELLKVANSSKASGTTLLPLDEFMQAFFIDEDDILRPDWYLARDLLLIRIIEQLSDAWIAEHHEDLEDISQSILEIEDE